MTNTISTYPTLIQVKDLTTNHKVQLESGEWVKIQSIHPGFYYRSKLLTYSNGLWSCFQNTDKVEAIYCD